MYGVYRDDTAIYLLAEHKPRTRRAKREPCEGGGRETHVNQTEP